MPTTELVSSLVTGAAYTAGSTRYSLLSGACVVTDTEAPNGLVARASLTLAKLFVRVAANAATTASTVTSREDAGAGAQSISVTALTTGLFQDTSNTDGLVDGGTFNMRAVTGATGSMTCTLFGATLNDAAANTTILAAGTGQGVSPGSNATFYGGLIGHGTGSNTEAAYQYTFRSTTTLSNLRIYLTQAPGVGCTIRIRKNAGNGAQSISVGVTDTGALEDVTNTDGLVAGDEANYSLTLGVASALNYSSLEVKSASANRQMIAAHNGTGNFTADRYLPPSGACMITGTELNAQAPARSSFTARNLYVYVSTNGLTDGLNIYFRLNTANSALTVTTPQSTTGVLEDTTNTVAVVSTDVYNYFVDHGGGAGNAALSLIGFEAAAGDALGAGGGGAPTFYGAGSNRGSRLRTRFGSR